MADVCVTCLYKDENPVFINQDQLVLLTKLLEPCSMFENLKHLLKVNAKICVSCQKKLMDIANFRSMVIMSLDLLNNMQDVFKADSNNTNYSNKNQYNMPTQQSEEPTYVTLGSDYVVPSVSQQQHKVDSKMAETSSFSHSEEQNSGRNYKIIVDLNPAYKCLAGMTESMPVIDSVGTGQEVAARLTDQSNIKQESVPKVPYVNVLPPPELIGSSPSGGVNDHDYSSGADTEATAAKEQVTQPLETDRQWYIKVLTSDQILEKMAEKRVRSDFASAPYKCTMCVIVFRSNEQLDAHTQACHTKAAGRFSCFVCSRRFPTLSALNRHVSLHSSRVYVCARCDFDSFDCREVKRHICIRGKKKKKSSRDSKPDTKFKCTVCESEFITSEFLTVHINKEHGKSKPLQCPKCDKTFKLAGRMKSHMIKIHGVTCKICQKKFQDETALETHTNACNKYEQIINKKFQDETALETHTNACNKYEQIINNE